MPSQAGREIRQDGVEAHLQIRVEIDAPSRAGHDRFVERLSGAHRRVDKVTIDYGYHEFANGANENAALTRIINDAWAKDLRFMTNQDLGVHPKVDQSSKG